MVLPAIKEQILTDLERLDSQQQQRAAELIHRLILSPVGVPGRALLHFSGSMDPQSVRGMTEAIEEGCERVDPDGW